MPKDKKKAGRKVISFREPTKISPIKEEVQSTSQSLPSRKKESYTPYPDTKSKITQRQLRELDKLSDRLVPSELFNLCLQKQEQQLEQFFENNPPQLKKAMRSILEDFHGFLEKMKKSRLQADQDQVHFVPPDSDLFETQIGKKQESIIKQNLQQLHRYKNQHEILFEYKEEEDQINDKINTECTIIEEDELEQMLAQVQQEQILETEQNYQLKKDHILNELIRLANIVDQKKIQKRKRLEEQRLTQIRDRIETRNRYKAKWGESPSLFTVEDILR